MTGEFFHPQLTVEVLSLFTTCFPVALWGAPGLLPKCSDASGIFAGGGKYLFSTC